MRSGAAALLLGSYRTSLSCHARRTPLQHLIRSIFPFLFSFLSIAYNALASSLLYICKCHAFLLRLYACVYTHIDSQALHFNSTCLVLFCVSSFLIQFFFCCSNPIMEGKEITCLTNLLHHAVDSPTYLLGNAAVLPPPPLLHVSLPLSTSQPPDDDLQAHISRHPSIDLQLQPSGHLLSQMSSLGFLPSLANLWPHETEFEELDHRCLATIQGERGVHISSLTVVGDHLYAGAGSSNSSSNSIRVWQTINLRECGGFGSGYGAAKALVVAGDWILSAHQDLKIRVWSRCRTNHHRPDQVAEGDNDLRLDLLQEVQASTDSIDSSHKLLASMPTVKDYIKSFIPSKNYVQVRRHHKRLWIEHVDNISMLAVGGSAADPLLYSASWDRTIKVWKLSEFKCVESFKAHDDAINALLVASTGFLYTASADAKVKVWGRSDVASGVQKHSLVACLDAHRSAVNALALSQDGERSRMTLYSAGCDRGIVVWEREEGAEHMVATGVLRGHRHAILCLVSRGRVLCSGSADHTIRVWHQSPYGRRLDGGGLAHSCMAILQGHKGPVKCLSLLYDAGGKHRLYSSSLDYDIRVWQLSGSVIEGEEERRNTLQQKHKDPMSHQIWKFHSI